MRKKAKYSFLILVMLMSLSISVAAIESNNVSDTGKYAKTGSPIVDSEALSIGPDETAIIIGFNDTITQQDITDLRNQKAKIKRILNAINAVSVTMPTKGVEPLRKNQKIKYVTENTKGVHNLTQTLPWGIDKIDAELVHPAFRGTGVVVSVPDTGVDYTHEDLVGRVVLGYDYVNNDPDPMDDYGHGTHVAGTIAANDNSIGVIGVAPEATVVANKVLDSTGSGYWDDVAASIIDSADAGIKIISMSLGGGPDPTVEAAVKYAYGKGVLLIAAAGNTGGAVIYPAAYPEVMAVTATDQNDVIAVFSSRGPEAEISAPGVSVLSTVPKGSCSLCDASGYRLLQGTSMATPHVAGTAALIWGAYPSLTRDQVRSRINDNSLDLGTPGRDNLYGFGRLRAYESVYAVPPVAPTVVKWSAVASTGAVDEADLGIFAFDLFQAYLLPSAPLPANLDIRYNVAAIDGVSYGNKPGIRVRYRDNGTSSAVKVYLREYNITSGASVTRMTFDSNSYAQSPGYQTKTKTICNPPWTFDFNNKIYYVEASLQKTASAGNPGLIGIQLTSSTC